MAPNARRPVALAAATGLLAALLASLAWLQYRWTGEVSRAERDRMLASLAAGAERFARDFDLELARLYLSFQAMMVPAGGGIEPLRGPVWPPRQAAAAAGDWREVLAGRVGERLGAWEAEASFPDLLGDVLLLTRPAGGERSAARLDRAGRRWVAVAVPAGLGTAEWDEGAAREILVRALPPRAARERVGTGPPLPWPPPPGVVIARRLLADGVPGLIVPLLGPPPAAAAPGGEPPHPLVRGALLLALDREVLLAEVFPVLAGRHFGAGERLAALLAVDDAAGSRLWTGPGGTPEGAPDLTVPLFALPGPERMRELAAAAPALDAAAGEPRGLSRRLRHPFLAGAFGEVPGAWRLAVWHPAGSLEVAVGRLRRRNLAVHFGVLAVLAGTVAVLGASARRARRLAEERMRFVATVSHDLRTPLAGIRALAQNLADGVIEEAEQVRRYGGLIEREGARLTERVERILDFSGTLAGRGSLLRRRVGVAELVRAAIEEALPSLLAEPRPGEEPPALELDVPPDLPAIAADPDALRRALVNLLANAARHGAALAPPARGGSHGAASAAAVARGEAAPGAAGAGGWIGVSVHAVAGRRGPEVAIRIADRGAGIPARELPRIFDPFFRGAEARRRRVEGTGLGLSLVKEIAEAHGGRVSAESRPGAGAVFTLTLPAAPAGD